MFRSVLLVIIVLRLHALSIAQTEESLGLLPARVVRVLPLERPGEVPLLIKFSGTLRDSLGTAVDKATDVTFAIFTSQTGGEPIWMERQVVIPDQNGNYAATLGSYSRGIPLLLFTNTDARWVGLVSDGKLQTNRTRILSVPYALKAGDATTLNGRPASDFVTVEQLRSYPVLYPAYPPFRSITSTGQMAAGSFRSTTTTGPSFISNATSGPPFTVSSETLVAHLNSDLLDGLSADAFAKLKAPNEFSHIQTLKALLLMAPSEDADSNDGHSSNAIGLRTSVKNSSTGMAETKEFQIKAEPVDSGSTNPTARLGFWFSDNGRAAEPIGFYLNSDGTLTFSARQEVPLGIIQSALNSAGLTAIANGSQASNLSTNPIVTTSDYGWTQTVPVQQSGSEPIQPGFNIVTLRPCPLGVDGTNEWHFLYVSGTGTPEAVLISGGSCKSGAPSGTVQFQAAYSHPLGYSIGSATDGAQEAIFAAIQPNSYGQIARNVAISPGSHTFHARLSVRASSLIISQSGSSITCAMQDTCIMLGDPANTNKFKKIIIQGLRLRPGVANGTWSAIEDNANGSTLSDIAPAPNPYPANTFGRFIQIDNDQAATIDNFDSNLDAPWARCDSTFCSTAIYGAGGGGNSGVLWIKNSNLSLNCKANGIDNQSGNTTRVSDTIVQAYPQIGIRSRGTYGTNTNLQVDNVYQEVGGCANPLYPGNLQAQTGVIVQGGQSKIGSMVGPAGNVPRFVNNGTLIYNYFVLIHSSVKGYSQPLLAGTAATNGTGPITVYWPQTEASTGTITFDLLRTSGLLAADVAGPYGESCTGGSSLACGAIASGITMAACSNGLCTYTDDAAAITQPYIVTQQTYLPGMKFWPGRMLINVGWDVNGLAGPTVTFDKLSGSNYLPIVSQNGAVGPSITVQSCETPVGGQTVWIECLDTSGGGSRPGTPGATMLATGGANIPDGGEKGRIIFQTIGIPVVERTHKITFVDSNPARTLATPGHRPPYDEADTYIGLDNPRAHVSLASMSLGAPIAISQYIHNVGDGVNWLERLTGSGKSFRVMLNFLNLATPPKPPSGNVVIWSDVLDRRFHDQNENGSIGTTVVASKCPNSQYVNGVSPAGALLCAPATNVIAASTFSGAASANTGIAGTNSNIADAPVGSAPATLANQVAKPVYAFPTLEDGISIIWDLGGSLFGIAKLTLEGSLAVRTLNVSGLQIGGRYTLEIQRNTGTASSLALGAGCSWKVPGSSPRFLALSGTANSIDILSVFYDGTNCLATFTPGFN